MSRRAAIIAQLDLLNGSGSVYQNVSSFWFPFSDAQVCCLLNTSLDKKFFHTGRRISLLRVSWCVRLVIGTYRIKTETFVKDINFLKTIAEWEQSTLLYRNRHPHNCIVSACCTKYRMQMLYNSLPVLLNDLECQDIGLVALYNKNIHLHFIVYYFFLINRSGNIFLRAFFVWLMSV